MTSLYKQMKMIKSNYNIVISGTFFIQFMEEYGKENELKNFDSL